VAAVSDLILHMQKVAGISGSEAHLLSLLPRLRERGWNVRMVMLHEHEPGAWEFARELRDRGVPLDAIPLRADVDPIAFVQLAAYLARHRPALLHTHLVHADVYGQLAGTLARVPLRFSTKHGFNEFREGREFALADRAVASLAHVHIAISRGLARYLADTEGFDERGFQIVHYGIPVDGAAPAFEPSPPRLLCVGRLIPIKGHVVLFRAVAAAREEVRDLELEIAGRGPLEPALRALVKELGLEESVRFLGHVVPVQRAIDRSSIVVVPSLGEGFGMVALEAMERARPVIAAAIGGLGAIVRHGETGLLVPPAEVEPLRAAIVELAKDPARAAAMGEAGRRRAAEHFGEARSIDRTELLYRAFLAAEGARTSTSVPRS
jgi:glycosyltransferase involved in cell wall biosynthesis